MYCLTVLEARSPRSRYWRVWFLLRPFPMICRCLHSPHLLPVRKDSQSFFSCKCTSGVSLCVQTSSSYKDSHIGFVVVVQLLSHVWLSVTPRTVAHQASLSFTISWNLLKLRSIETSNCLILWCLLLLLPSIFPSIRVFSNESALHIRWAKYWCFSCSNSPSSDYSGLISFRLTGLISLQSRDSQESSPSYGTIRYHMLWYHSTIIC